MDQRQLKLSGNVLPHDITLEIGDICDLGQNNGLIVWFDKEEAEAYRIFMRKHQESVQRALQSTRKILRREDE